MIQYRPPVSTPVYAPGTDHPAVVRVTGSWMRSTGGRSTMARISLRKRQTQSFDVLTDVPVILTARMISPIGGPR